MAADPTAEPGPIEVSMEDDVAEAADVDAFVRLAVDSIDRLVSDAATARELRALAQVTSGDAIERMLAAQRVLARVLAYEQATLGASLSVAEVEDLAVRRRLEVEEAARLVYELALAGGRSWPAVQLAALPPDDASDIAGEAGDPWPAALRLAVLSRAPEGASRAVRRALEAVRTRPLGFARLALELADAVGDASALAQVDIVLDDPFLRRESPRRFFDLRARCIVYQADAARRAGRLGDCDEALASLPRLLAAGTGDADLQALVAELRAGRALAAGDRDEALRRLFEADELLAASPVEDSEQRLAEVRLKRALVLAADPSRRGEALEALRRLADTVASADDTVDARLRLRVVLAGVRVELDLARQEVAATRPLGTGDESPPAAALSTYARAWSQQAARLERVGDRLRAADILLHAADERGQAELDWCRGLSLLLADRARAAELLRSALAEFRRLGDEASVEQISVDLIVCGVLAGTLGDPMDEEIGDGSEPLELFRQLAARTR